LLVMAGQISKKPLSVLSAGIDDLKRARLIASKEIRHILRDPISLIIAVLMPIMMTLIYGYAINLDMKNIELGIIDLDNTFQSREFGESFYVSGYFVRPKQPVTLADADKLLQGGKVDAVLTIRPGFAEALAGAEKYELGLLIDGSDGNLAIAASNYAEMILAQYILKQITAVAQRAVDMSVQVAYNQDLKSSHHFVPGLVAVILMMISALLTSVTIAREKETGTLEQLLTSPATPQEIIVGKILPYIALAFIDGLLVLLFALIVFAIPFNGSGLLLLLFGFIYVAAALSIGVLISTLVSTMQLAMMASLLVTLLPSVILSGYIFDVRNMPYALQLVSRLVPARYFIVIIRGIMLKGSDITVLWVEAAALMAICLVLLGLAVKRFRLKLR